MDRCPCLSGLPLGQCCRPVHRDHARAVTAEQLMRSRYTAFAVGDAAHLLRTWHASTRPTVLPLDGEVRWDRLDVLDTTAGGMFDDAGTVEFRASYRGPDGRGSQQERSRFVREDRLWFYLDADPGPGRPG